MLIFLKAHVSAYTKKNGTFVAAHEDKRVAAKVKDVHGVRKLIDQNGGKVFVRWSGSTKHDMSDGAHSRDYANGGAHSGLSAVPLTSDMSDHEIAKYVGEYSFLRLKGKNIVPHFFTGDEVGEDSDGYPSIKPKAHVGSGHRDFVNDLDGGLAEKLRLKHEIERAEKTLESGAGDKIGREIIAEKLEKNKKKLAEMNGGTLTKSVVFFKSHIDTYTRKDGVVVQAHDDKRRSIEKHEVHDVADKLAQHFRDHHFDVQLQHSGSAFGRSSYLRVNDPLTGKYVQHEIRVSDHHKSARNESLYNNVKTHEDVEELKRKIQESFGDKAARDKLKAEKEKASQDQADADTQERQAKRKTALMLIAKRDAGEALTGKDKKVVSWYEHEVKNGRLEKALVIVSS